MRTPYFGAIVKQLVPHSHLCIPGVNMSSANLNPNVFWAQTESKITLKVDLKDVKVSVTHVKYADP